MPFWPSLFHVEHTESQTEHFIWTTGEDCSNSFNHDRVQVLSYCKYSLLFLLPVAEIEPVTSRWFHSVALSNWTPYPLGMCHCRTIQIELLELINLMSPSTHEILPVHYHIRCFLTSLILQFFFKDNWRTYRPKHCDFTNKDEFYCSWFSDCYLHLYCCIHNVSDDTSSSLLLVFVGLSSLYGISNHILYLIHGGCLFWFH